jgi:RNA polymerase sigma-70 factor (ECF subfamily)
MHTDPRLLDPTFLLEHDARLRALARRLVHDAGLADDVAQDVWLRALRGSHRVETRISGWLSGIACHVAFGRNRERAARSRRELATPPPSPTPSAEDLAAREAARRAVVAAVMRLPDAARDVVVLRFFDDLSSREISKRVGAPIETVRTRSSARSSNCAATSIANTAATAARGASRWRRFSRCRKRRSAHWLS